MSRHLLNPRIKRYMHRRRELPAWQQQSGTWTINGTYMTNTPSTSAELLSDPGLEGTYTSGRCNQFTAQTGSPTLSQSADVHGGSKSQQMIGAANGNHIDFTVSETLGTWYKLSAWVKRSAGSAGGATISLSDGSNAVTVGNIDQSSYTQVIRAFLCLSTASNYVRMNGGAAGTWDTLLADDFSMVSLTLNTLFAVKTGSANPAVVGANGTLTFGCPAGVVYGLDSLSSPANFILAMHDGNNKVYLHKCVSGVWTQLVSATVSVVAGILPQIKYTGSNTYQLWYNGVQRGTNQTVTDAGTGTLHGVFNTHSGNTITGFYAA